MPDTRKTEPVARTSPDLTTEQLARLKEIFPGAFSEGKVDFDKLRAALGDSIDESPERYAFTWAGKRDALRLLQTPSRATLVPARAESVNFDATENIFIEGDNLEVLKLLYKAYFGRVKMIGIDPPYNTGNDFVYPDNYADPLDMYLKITGQKDSAGNLLTSNPETSGRYHSAWLSMMYPRLFLARQLLREDGVIFVHIDDHEVHNLRLLMNEVFGEENFIQHIIWNSKYTVAGDATTFSSQHEHILCYARNANECVIQPLPRTEEMDAAYKNPDDDSRGPWKPTPLHAKSGNKNFKYTFRNGRTWTAPPGRWPRFSKESLRKLDEENRIWFGSDGESTPNVKTFLSEVKAGKTPGSVWRYEEVGHTHLANEQLASLLGKGTFDNPKPVGLIKRFLQLSTENNDLILDFFAGSCTTAQAVLEQNREDDGNRRFIMAQLPEPLPAPVILNGAKRSEEALKTHEKDSSPKSRAQNGNQTVLHTIADIGKERIRRVIAKMQKERAGKLDLQTRETPEDLGFKVFKLAESNYKQWTFTAEQDLQTYAQQAELFADPLVEGWRAENVIYEVAVKEGYGLHARIERVGTILRSAQDKHLVVAPDGQGQALPLQVVRVTDPDREQSFYICLDDKIEFEKLKPLARSREDLFICRDRALNDETAANLALQCRLKTL